MALSPLQLQELQDISIVLAEEFPSNVDSIWDTAVRFQLADLGPLGPGGIPTFEAAVADLKVTQEQLQTVQGRNAGPSSGYIEATLEVAPPGGAPFPMGALGDVLYIDIAPSTYLATSVLSLTPAGPNSVILSEVAAQVARTVAPAAGGIEVNNLLTGAGFERVLTTADITAMGGQVDSVVAGTAITVNAADPVNPIVNFNASTALTFFAQMQFNNAVRLRYTLASADSPGVGQIHANGDDIFFVDQNGVSTSLLSASPLTTVGDLFAFDGADARLPVGADGLILTAASGEATGLIWAAAPAAVIPDPLILGSINLTSSVSIAAGAPYGDVPINIGANLTGTQGMTRFARQFIQTQPSAFGFNSTLFINTGGAGTSGSDTFIGGTNSANIEVEFGVAVRFQHGLVATVVAETAAPAAGGFLANNLATGAGLERVLTTSDLGGAPVTQIVDGAANIAVIAEGSGLTGLRSVGNTDAEDRGLQWEFQNGTVRASIGNEFFTDLIYRNHIAGRHHIFRVGIGGGNRIRLHLDGDQTIGGCSLYAGSSATPRLQTLNHGVEVGNGTLFLVEQAAQEADIVGQGQLWVNSADDSLNYITEAGVVFDLTAGAASSLQATMGVGSTSSIDLSLITGASLIITDAADVDTVTIEINTTTMAPAEALAFIATTNIEVYSFDEPINIDGGDIHTGGATSGIAFYRYGDSVSSSLRNSAAGITLQIVASGDTFRIQSDSIELSEASAPVAFSSSFGQIWIEDESPCRLKFMNDDGDDYTVAIAGGTQGDNVFQNASHNFNTAGNKAANFIGYFVDGGSDTVTLENSSSVVNWPVWTSIQLIAPGSNLVTITEGTGITLSDDQGNDVGPSVVLQQGVVSIIRVSTTSYIIWGSGWA